MDYVDNRVKEDVKLISKVENTISDLNKKMKFIIKF